LALRTAPIATFATQTIPPIPFRPSPLPPRPKTKCGSRAGLWVAVVMAVAVANGVSSFNHENRARPVILPSYTPPAPMTLPPRYTPPTYSMPVHPTWKSQTTLSEGNRYRYIPTPTRPRDDYYAPRESAP
jgi:hypothetical protein